MHVTDRRADKNINKCTPKEWNRKDAHAGKKEHDDIRVDVVRLRLRAVHVGRNCYDEEIEERDKCMAWLVGKMVVQHQGTSWVNKEGLST